MTTITFNTAPRMAAIASKLRSLLGMLGDALDAFAVYRMQHAVPESEIRRAEREIGRYRQSMRAARTAANSAPHGRCAATTRRAKIMEDAL